jgi:hypothetical protein
MRLLNHTPFIAERYALADENGANLLLIIIKATFSFDRNGKVVLAEECKPIELADQYFGEPGKSSIKYASDFSFDKTATDIALSGFAYAPNGQAKETNVILQAGVLRKTIKIYGDRQWETAAGKAYISTPKLFDRIPLVYERAFGGIDNSHPDQKYHEAEMRNPVGTGFLAAKTNSPIKGLRIPNLEDPKQLIHRPMDRPKPACFGFIGPSWLPRLKLAGTYDSQWNNQRKPLLPKDFSKHFFNAATPDLVYNGFINGNEFIKAAGVSPLGEINFSLPEVQPICTVETLHKDMFNVKMRPAKLFIDVEKNEFLIVWSGNLKIFFEFNDVEAIQCSLN